MRTGSLSAGHAQTILLTPVVLAARSTLSGKLALALLFVEEPNSAHGHSNHFAVFFEWRLPLLFKDDIADG